MRVRWSLSRKVLLVALLNFLLLALLVTAIARFQFGLQAESFLLGPVRDRITALGNNFSMEYETTAPDGRDQLVASWSRQIAADVYVSTPRGERIAGLAVELPSQVIDQMRLIVPPPQVAPPALRSDSPPQADPPKPRSAPPPRNGSPETRPASPQQFGPPDPRPGPPPRNGPGGPPPRQDEPPAEGRPLREDQPPPRQDSPPPRRDPPPPRDDRPPREASPPRQDPPPVADSQAPRPQMPIDSVFLVITHNPKYYWAGVRIPLRSFEGERTRPGILLFRSTSLFNSNLFFDWRLWVAAVVSVIAISMLCWLPFLRGLTRSIAGMDRATKEMAQGNFDIQVAHRRQDELGDLGEQIDRLGARLGGFVKNQKRFLGDIAHELCAPISRIQFALGILEQKAEESLRPHVAVLHEEVQEMSGLVNELLQFSKAGLESRHAPLAAVDVASVVRRAASREPSPTAFEIAVPAGLTVMAHEEYLLRALANLLRNAVRYAGSSGAIAVTARREKQQVEIVVADRGPGLPESELEQVFAPFYRPEASRTRETGGAGLGLAIVKTCVERCGGTVIVRNREGGGLEVTVRLSAG